MKAKLRFIAAITSSVAMVAGISSCSNASQENTSSKSTPIAVEVDYPSSNQNSNFEVSGKVEAKQVANISTKLMGYITKIHAKVGDHVVQGQLLASIESQDIQAKKAQAQAMVAELTPHSRMPRRITNASSSCIISKAPQQKSWRT